MAGQMSPKEIDENIFSFAFIADPQIGINSPEGLRGANSDKQRLDRAIDFVNQNGIEFVIFGGDQIDSIDSYNAQLEGLLRAQQLELNSLADQLGRVSEVSRSVIPLMQRMVTAIEEFVRDWLHDSRRRSETH